MKKVCQIISLIAVTVIYSACKKDLPNGGITSCDLPASVETIDSCTVAIPNMFTPNGDGFNDIFTIIINNAGTAVLENPHLIIQNEGEITISEGFELTSSWDGKVDGTTQFGVFQVSFSVFINGAENIFESSVYSLPYNTSEFEAIDCADCYFAAQWNGASFDGGLDNHEVVCE